MSSSFMLSMDHPYVLSEIERVPSGLLPFEGLHGHPHKLVIKASKELILTALQRREFFMYLAPVEVSGISSFSIFSAFFDDPDEPLFIFTPFVEDAKLAEDVFRIIQSENFEVFFFDQLNRERLGFTASSTIPISTSNRISSVQSFVPMSQLREVHSQCYNWFSTRNEGDDKAAIKIKLQEELFPTDAMMLDLRNDGASGPIHVSSLERHTNPGDMQELEISECLQRIIGDGEISIGPLRIDTDRELADVVAVTEKSVFIVQAKDIENTKRSIDANIQRKISKSIKKVKEGMVQLKGAIKFSQRDRYLVIKDKETSEVSKIDLHGRTIYGLVIVTELFDYEYGDYTKLSLRVGQDLGVSCVPMSFPQLAEYTFELPEEGRFIDALCTIYWQGILNGSFPKLRFNYPADDGG
ncbi:hypothetical protein [Leisingera sp. ANG59]|uniref:hypothetical protein n=1 Tax=Leisingera sp. ANG59 TaxID=2675221 RepID=UPI001572D885|nr:hypothetical protein [Leisingera sp. ANG59]